MSVCDLLNNQIKILNLGSKAFISDFERQDVNFTHIEWKPSANGNREMLNLLKKSLKYADMINTANEVAIDKIKSSEGRLINILPAKVAIKNMKDYMILHAGPKIEWDKMAKPMQGAIVGAILFEGWAKNEDQAWSLASSGKIEYEPCHEYQTVGPMAGIVSPSMPVHIIFDEINNNFAYCSVNEGLGKVLRFGAYDSSVINRLTWIRNVFAPVLNEALIIGNGIDIKNIIEQALQMGDECHNRNKASTSIFLNQIASYIVKTKADIKTKVEIIDFIRNNEHYFLNLSMAFSKVSLDAARNVPYSSVCVAMARNGVDFGIQIAGLDNYWSVAPANFVQGLYFSGFSEDDATRDLGDSAITETRGIGGFAMGSSPAIVKFVGGNVSDALNYSRKMHDISDSKNDSFTIPGLDFYPTALGINLIKVIYTGILPIINTGIAHKDAGVGQIGAGLTTPPMACFEQAFRTFMKQFETVN